MSKGVVIATSGSGSLLDKCLSFNFFKESLVHLVTDRECGALKVATKHKIPSTSLGGLSDYDWNQELLGICRRLEPCYIISYSNLKIFRGDILDFFENRILNSHYSILPAFKGTYSSLEKKSPLKPRQLFERMMRYGSRVIGNTVHVVNEDIDEGIPILVSTMNVPYNEAPAITRHRLFLQECKCLLQMVKWIVDNRLAADSNQKIVVRGARFKDPWFSPNLDNDDIMKFALPIPSK